MQNSDREPQHVEVLFTDTGGVVEFAVHEDGLDIGHAVAAVLETDDADTAVEELRSAIGPHGDVRQRP
jgi:hypothetical protein